MNVKICNRFDLSVIFECECDLESESLRLGFAVKAALAAKINLRSADLSYADLSSANLRYANLRYADLRYANLRYADLSSADLRYADLRYADLSYANLRSANLRSADLRYADLRYVKGITDNTPLPEGVTLGEFKTQIVPQLLTAGGKTVGEVVASGAWECHEWSNCPMHVALGIDSATKAPPLLRPWVERFVQLFDAKLIPCPVVEGAVGDKGADHE